MQIDKARVLPIVRAALKEDIGKGDITTQSIVGRLASARAVIVTRESCAVCGVGIAEMVMAQIDRNVRFEPNCIDGAFIGPGKEVAFLEGSTASILRAERTMLNFITFLSGVSTRTYQYIEKVKPSEVKIMDTRKTIPLLRYLEKYAVSMGGGTNHRMGLYDQVLIKDNHIHCRKLAFGQGRKFSLKGMIEEARKKNPENIKVEIEVSNLEEFSDALSGKPDVIMLDNMNVEDIKACVEARKLCDIKPLLEVSGGITLDTISKFAHIGIDMISVGELTDSVRAIDMSLDLL